MRKIKLEPYSIYSEKIPKSFDGCKIAFLTDLHNNLYGEKNQYLIEKINSVNPDYIMITGDMIVGSKDCDTKIAMELLERLAKEWKVFYSLGNHEQKIQQYPETRDTVYHSYFAHLKELGIIVLDNQTFELKRGNESIFITGLTIDFFYYGKIWKRIHMNQAYLEKQIGKKKKDKYQILLAHNPAYFDCYADWGADLTLSGHVHGGIMILPKLGGVIAPSYQLFPTYDFGLFEKGEHKMVLSRGLGTHTIHLRIHNRPELSCITLKTKQKKLAKKRKY